MISVIIPVYNVQDYLERCLDSIINNTYQDLEIICVDDGSTDDCLNILRKYEKIDSRIKVISKENGGISSARNAGLEYCSGDFIAFIDSDDWIHKEYFSILMKIQEKNDYDVVICDYTRTKEIDALKFGVEKYECEEVDRKKYIMCRKYKSHVWGRVYKKETIDMIKYEAAEKIEDALFNMEFASKNIHLNAAYVNVPLYAYFVREGSLVTKIDKKSVFDLSLRYYEYAEMEADTEMKDILYMDCIKRSMAARYEYHVYKEKHNEAQANYLARNSLKKMHTNDLKLSIMVKYPFVYRFVRILNDPTLLTHEKNVKNILKQEKRK